MIELLAVVVFFIVLCLAIANARAGDQQTIGMRAIAQRRDQAPALDDLASRDIVAFGHIPSAEVLIEQDWRRAEALGERQLPSDVADIQEATP